MQNLMTAIAIAGLAFTFSYSAQAATKKPSNAAKVAKCKLEAQYPCRPSCTPNAVKAEFQRCMQRK